MFVSTCVPQEGSSGHRLEALVNSFLLCLPLHHNRLAHHHQQAYSCNARPSHSLRPQVTPLSPRLQTYSCNARLHTACTLPPPHSLLHTVHSAANSRLDPNPFPAKRAHHYSPLRSRLLLLSALPSDSELLTVSFATRQTTCTWQRPDEWEPRLTIAETRACVTVCTRQQGWAGLRRGGEGNFVPVSTLVELLCHLGRALGPDVMGEREGFAPRYSHSKQCSEYPSAEVRPRARRAKPIDPSSTQPSIHAETPQAETTPPRTSRH
jgi:hypothetical protein